jgi:hypothetical protein
MREWTVGLFGWLLGRRWRYEFTLDTVCEAESDLECAIIVIGYILHYILLVAHSTVSTIAPNL